MKTPLAIYERCKKSPYSLIPLYLPGRPTSFQTYLTNIVNDPGKTNEKRVALYLASGNTSKHKNCAIQAFVAASFPPVKVGSFASELIDYTFKEHVVTPQNVIADTKCNSNAKCNNFCHKL